MAPEELVDAQEVLNNEILWRMIAPNHFRNNPETGETIDVSEGAFRTQQMSVFRASRKNLREALSQFPGFKVAAFSAEFVRSIGCILVLDPIDPSHVLVCPKDNPLKRLTGNQANQLRRNLNWVEELST